MARTDPSGSYADYASTAASSAPTSTPVAQGRASYTTSTGGNDEAFGLTEREMALQILFGRPVTDMAHQTFAFRPDPTLDTGLHGAPGFEFTSGGDLRGMLDATKYFYGIDPTKRAVIQAALYESGLIKKKGWQNFGEPDETSGNAWRTLLTRTAKYNAAHTPDEQLTVWEMLAGKRGVDEAGFFKTGDVRIRNALTATAGGGGGGRGRAPLQVQVANPEELKVIASQAAQDTLGYVPDDDYLSDFVKLYQGMQTTTQKQAYAGKSRITAPGGADVQAGVLARKQNETEAQGYDIVKAFQTMLGAIGVEGG